MDGTQTDARSSGFYAHGHHKYDMNWSALATQLINTHTKVFFWCYSYARTISVPSFDLGIMFLIPYNEGFVSVWQSYIRHVGPSWRERFTSDPLARLFVRDSFCDVLSE